MANTVNSRQSSRRNWTILTLALSFLLGVLPFTPSALAQVRIWELPLDTSISNADSIPFADANSSATPRTKRMTVASIRTTINALDYGLICDNFTDNHAAIEAAIAACPTHGCIVEIPWHGDAKCKITGDIDIGDGSAAAQSTRHGVTLRGVAWSGNTSEMTVASQKGIQIVWGGAAGGTMLSINGPIMGITIENLNFVGENGANDAGTFISAFHCAQCTFRNINFSGYTGTGMRISAVGAAGLPAGVVLGGDDNHYENLQMAGATSTSAIALDLGPTDATGAGAATDNARNYFVNCEFRGGTGAAGRGAIFRFTDNNVFTQVHFVGGKSIEIISPTGNAGFPVALTFLHGVITGDILVTGTWTPTGDQGLLFLPLAVESGTIPADSRIRGLAYNKWFGPFVVNDEGVDADFRFEGDTDVNLLFGDTSTNRVGIGTATPSGKFHISGTADESQLVIQGNGTQTTSVYAIFNSAATVLSKLDNSGNLFVGNTSAVGTNGTRTLLLASGVLPTTSPADAVQLSSNDTVAGQANLWIRNEEGKSEQITGTLSRNSAQFDKAANTTLSDVTGLTRNVVAGRTYKFEAVLRITADATGGSKYAIAGTATATTIGYNITLTCSGTPGAISVSANHTALASSSGQAGCTSGIARISGSIVVNAAGTLTVQFAQNAANGTSSVLALSTWEVETTGD